jgi:hypothetical protein
MNQFPASPPKPAVSDSPVPDSRHTFRSPFAVAIWWLWVLFAVANLIDLAVQGRDHLAVVAVFILLLVTGVAYVTVQRPRIVADDAGMTVMNPLRNYRVGWSAVAGIDPTDLLRVRCEWPLGGQDEQRGPGLSHAGRCSPLAGQATAQLRRDRHRTRSRAPRPGACASISRLPPATPSTWSPCWPR